MGRHRGNGGLAVDDREASEGLRRIAGQDRHIYMIRALRSERTEQDVPHAHAPLDGIADPTLARSPLRLYIAAL
jgi:hypothetical protein